MNNNDPGGLSPQQMRTLGIMGGLFLLCFIVISLVSDLDIPGPIHTLIRFAPTGIILIATYYAARHVSSTSDNGAQERSTTPTPPSAGEHPARPPENSEHEAGEGSAQHPPLRKARPPGCARLAAASRARQRAPATRRPSRAPSRAPSGPVPSSSTCSPPMSHCPTTLKRSEHASLRRSSPTSARWTRPHPSPSPDHPLHRNARSASARSPPMPPSLRRVPSMRFRRSQRAWAVVWTPTHRSAPGHSPRACPPRRVRPPSPSIAHLSPNTRNRRS